MLFLLFSNMVFIRVLFFLMFCENIFRVSLIIVFYCLLPMARRIELALVSQASCAFFECQSLLNQFLQKGHL